MKSILYLIPLFFAFILTACQQEKIPITTDSEVAREYYVKARDLAERIRYQEAVEYYKMALKHDPDFPMANYAMTIFGETPSERLDYFEKTKSVMDQASWGEQQLILALEAGMSAYVKKQIELIEKLVKEFPRDERALNILGNIYFSQQEYEKAIEIYNRALAINPEYSQTYNQLGYSYRYLGDYVNAENAFKKYIELIPDDPNPYDSYAELLLKMGEYEISIENYEKALKIDPDFMNSYMGLASNYNIKREYSTARKYLKEFYLRSKSQDLKRTALTALIISNVDEGNLDGAMKWITRRYDDSQASGDTVLIAGDINLMGYWYRLKDQPDEAMEKYRQARELIAQANIPENIKNNFRRVYPYQEALIALMKNEFDLAQEKQIEYQEEAEKVENPNQMRLAHELAGQIALAKGEYSEAIEQLQSANQQSAQNLFRIAQAYEGMDSLDKALGYYARAANFNGFMDIDYALVRTDAEKKAAELQAKLKNM